MLTQGHVAPNLDQIELAVREKKWTWENWLYLIITVHIIAWSVLPFVMRFNLPMDAIEGSIWGHHLQWGYDKNPYLSGWLAGLATWLDNYAGWATYFFSQISVGICFLAVWKLATKILPPVYAFLSVLLLEGVQYYSLHAIDFDDNTIELALWALTIVNFYNALKSHTYRDWMLTGLCAGLSMMTKYYTLMLLIPLFIFMVQNSDARSSLGHLSPYAGILVFLAIITPHVLWLFTHDFTTVQYALERVTRSAANGHFNFSELFAWQQIETFIPALLLACFLLLGERPLRVPQRFPLSPYDKQFLFYAGVGPYLLTVLLSTIAGMKLRAGWGEPLLSLWGIILIAWLQPRLTPLRFKLFITAFVLLVTATLTGYALSVYNPRHDSGGNFPGKMIASRITREWHSTYHTPLFFVAGSSSWIAGNISYYSTDHPAVYLGWNKNNSPWIDENELKTRGGVFVWETAKGHKLTAELKQRYPRLGDVKILHFKWWRHPEAKPVEIAVAFLPPVQVNPQKINQVALIYSGTRP